MMGTAGCEEDQFLCRLQELHFSIPSCNSSPSLRTDSLRNISAHLRLAQTQGILPVEAESCVVKGFEDDYGTVVDSLDEKSGLNNFAEGALAICSKHKNESQKWKSTLTLDALKSKDFYQKLNSQAMSISKSYLPKGSDNDTVFKKTDNKENNTASLDKSRNQSSTSDTLSRQFNFQRHNTSQTQWKDRQKSWDNQQPENGSTHGASIDGAHRTGSHQRQTTPAWTSSSNMDIESGDTYSRKRPLLSNNVAGGRSGQRNFGSSGGQPSLFPNNEHPRRGPDPGVEEDDDDVPHLNNPFKTAKQQLAIDQQKKYSRGGGGNHGQGQPTTSVYGTGKKSLGTRRGPSSKFVPPIAGREENGGGGSNRSGSSGGGKGSSECEEPVDERLKGIEPKMIELIMNEVMDHGPQMDWSDIAGLEFAKKTIKEIVVWPMLRPDIFTGLRGPPKGLLLFGPPGTGKTLIGKCIASQSKSTFFSISASSLTSKWVGEGEKMVRALFAVARCNQPAVVFIDEIDSLLSQRSDGEHEASRRIKTEFLVQLDGAGTQSEDRILVIGATNRPQEIDEAARRRFVKRLYIPLPDTVARQHIIQNLMSSQSFRLSDTDIQTICETTDGYSGADMANLCREAALGPVRSIPFEQIETITADQVPPITFPDFQEAFLQVRASVSQNDLDLYINWNKQFGSFGKT
ncbi:fidgetin-like protein 1 isoform X1 [Haliotis rufescens]|uniref:fidgetin-like protein 1 isoform X1 n=1 Tax=Haliotis rufescens TaxID=6454 RepID=UPI00201ECEBC|nr:fidgetin-like protein 1 isoform X1 [Haliotis rufescens]XP_048248697.1 fidgetin-like protein 1 isoform X1 [Haliotis rufescens]